jgi:hypothetical protein
MPPPRWADTDEVETMLPLPWRRSSPARKRGKRKGTRNQFMPGGRAHGRSNHSVQAPSMRQSCA